MSPTEGLERSPERWNTMHDITFESVEMQTVSDLALRAARTNVCVMIEGESGVGKEVIARYIHANSKRKTAPFVPVNCGAIPDSLFESEFFGYERGAFTNAITEHRGYFEQADRGTILLDEISETPVHMQVKLLRVLEDMQIVHIGSESRKKVDVRVIVATNRSLLPLVQKGNFRHDLYYRISHWPIVVPPLRSRRIDIKPLAFHFLKMHGTGASVIGKEALEKLLRYDWPGNVRELESCFARALIQSAHRSVICADDIKVSEPAGKMDNAERVTLERALKSCKGNIRMAADFLRVHRNTVYNRMKYHGINPKAFRVPEDMLSP
jgi:transcriptional regulator with PAS, ATPase and Fis domain